MYLSKSPLEKKIARPVLTFLTLKFRPLENRHFDFLLHEAHKFEEQVKTAELVSSARRQARSRPSFPRASASGRAAPLSRKIWRSYLYTVAARRVLLSSTTKTSDCFANDKFVRFVADETVASRHWPWNRGRIVAQRKRAERPRCVATVNENRKQTRPSGESRALRT